MEIDNKAITGLMAQYTFPGKFSNADQMPRAEINKPINKRHLYILLNIARQNILKLK